MASFRGRKRWKVEGKGGHKEKCHKVHCMQWRTWHDNLRNKPASLCLAATFHHKTCNPIASKQRHELYSTPLYHEGIAFCDAKEHAVWIQVGRRQWHKSEQIRHLENTLQNDSVLLHFKSQSRTVLLCTTYPVALNCRVSLKKVLRRQAPTFRMLRSRNWCRQTKLVPAALSLR